MAAALLVVIKRLLFLLRDGLLHDENEFGNAPVPQGQSESM